MARQEAGFLLHRLCCLPPACLPMLSGQPGSKHPIIALACAQHRSTSSAKAGRQQYLALTLLWQEQVAISRLSQTEVRTGTAVSVCKRVLMPQDLASLEIVESGAFMTGPVRGCDAGAAGGICQLEAGFHGLASWQHRSTALKGIVDLQEVTHIAVAGIHAAVALASGTLQFVDLQKVDMPRFL